MSGSSNEEQKYGSPFIPKVIITYYNQIYPAVLFHLVSVLTLSPGGNSQRPGEGKGSSQFPFYPITLSNYTYLASVNSFGEIP